MSRFLGTCLCFLAISFGAKAQGDWFGRLFPQNRVLDSVELRQASKTKAASPVKIKYDANVVCVGKPTNLKVDYSLYGATDTNIVCEWFAVGDSSLGKGLEHTRTYFIEGDFRIAVKVTDKGYLVGCDTLVIHVTNMPQYTPVYDTICRGMEATVGMQNGKHFAWETGGTTEFINIRPAVTTTYKVRVSNQPIVEAGYRNACYAEDSAIVTVNDSAIFLLAGDAEMCEGFDAVVRVANGTNVFWNGVPGSNEYSLHIVRDTSVNVLATDKYGCRGIKKWTVTMVAEPRGEMFVYVNDFLTDSVCLGSLVRAEVESEMDCRYRWFNRDTAYYTEFVPQSDFTIFCDISVGGSLSGRVCKTRLKQSISVRNCHNVYFASGFVLDGITKKYGPIGVNDTTRTYQFMIFNPNGTMVYSTTRFTEGWDGRYRGQWAPTGVYTYVYIERYRNLVWERRGTVAVIK